MYDSGLLLERLQTVLTALERIPRRCADISQPSDFLADDAGLDRMDAICMILIAAGVVWHRGRLEGIGTIGEAATLTALATLLIVLPLYAFQVGIALTTPLTANVLRSLGPVFVFGLQQADGRLSYSTPTLMCILAYSMAAIASNVAHARHDAGGTAAKSKEPNVSAGRLRLPAAR